MPVRLTPEQLSAHLAIRDLTDPAEGGHAVQLVVDRVVHALARRWGAPSGGAAATPPPEAAVDAQLIGASTKRNARSGYFRATRAWSP